MRVSCREWAWGVWGSEDVPAYAGAEREDVGQPDAPVGDGGDDVEVAGTQFVVERDAAVYALQAARDVVFPALSDEDVEAHGGAEAVVALGVAAGL